MSILDGMPSATFLPRMVKRDGIALVTTHDLALTEIAWNGLPGASVHFEDSGELGELRSDYKPRPGVLIEPHQQSDQPATRED